MQSPVHRRAFAAILCAWVVGPCQPGTADSQSEKKTKPNIAVRASPTVGFSPARVVFTAELKGGADDHEDFYCATVEWEWGDGTRSEARADCEPYEAGKSEIKRRYVTEHMFNTSGDYRVQFRLKQKTRVVGFGSTDVKVRPGIRDGEIDR
jgi:hypothetical protein